MHLLILAAVAAGSGGIDPAIWAAIASAVGILLAAVFGYLGVRGANRQRADKQKADQDLNRLTTILDAQAQELERRQKEIVRLHTENDHLEIELDTAQTRIRQLENTP